MRVVLMTLVLCCALDTAMARQEGEASLADVLARLAESLPEDEAGSAEVLLEELAELARSPLAVNTASASDLTALPLIDAAAAEAIVSHRAREGPFRSVADLRAVPALASLRVDLLAPFVRFDDAGPPSALRLSLLSRAARRMERSRGFDTTVPGGYLGGPLRMLWKGSVARPGRWRGHLTLDKDPGEPWNWRQGRTRYGFDFASASLQLDRLGPARNVVAGDYTVDFGLGLALGGGAALAGDPLLADARSPRGLRPSRSSLEDGFFRGLAVEVPVRDGLHATGFLSARRRDARVDSSATPPYVMRFSDGLHRTTGERAAAARLGERVGGLMVQVRTGRFSGGVLAYREAFDGVTDTGGARPYQASGVVSAFGEWQRPEIVLTGEVARAPSGAIGLVVSARWLRPLFGLSVFTRSLPTAFDVHRARPSGKATSGSGNERGAGVGLSVRPHPYWLVEARLDGYLRPASTLGASQTERGGSGRATFVYSPRRWFEAELRYDERSTPVRLTVRDAAGRLLAAGGTADRRGWRTEIRLQPTTRLRLRTRLERVVAASPGVSPTQGTLLFVDLRLRAGREATLAFRLTHFDTEDYAARVYAVETGVREQFGVTAFSGTGRRLALLAGFPLGAGFTLQAHLAATHRLHVTHLGDGLDRTQGPKRRDVTVQVLWRR